MTQEKALHTAYPGADFIIPAANTVLDLKNLEHREILRINAAVSAKVMVATGFNQIGFIASTGHISVSWFHPRTRERCEVSSVNWNLLSFE
jgi:hypothetical protein